MVSVIIPVYQVKAHLNRCVDSWLAQTEKELELILVDDGSADGSGGICDEYARKYSFVHVIHQENAGVSAARNAGIGAAAGEFVLFTDSDDYVAPDYLDQMTAFQKKTGADLVLCGFHHLYEGADIVKLPGETSLYEMRDFSEVFLELYEKSYLNMPWNKLYRRSMMGRFDENLSLGEDLLFNLDYLQKCKTVGVLSEPLCYYIQEESRVTLSSQKRQNRLELGKLVCRQTEQFYQDTWGKTETDGRILSRYVNEILDECEKLPSDHDRSYTEKLQAIKSYARDEWVQKRGGEVKLCLPDYRILWPFLRRGQARTVYLLCVLRRWMVVAVHAARRKKSYGTFD